MKYVVVTGGVVSGLGKGITSSSIGVLLKACGLNVTAIKIDPYLNTDAGTMSPYEHGECYVLDDGGESDLDLGNYERFLGNITLTRDHNITTGKMYAHVIARERRGDYLGKTVQVVPHITDAIQEWIERVAHIPVDGTKHVPDVCLIELGGTVGDIESMVYLESLRQLQYRVGHDNFCLVHVSLVPTVGGGGAGGGEQKSKPTQHGVRELRAAGLNPDLVACRSAAPLERGSVEKISHYAMLSSDNVISVYDVSNIYRVPLILLEQRVPSLILARLKINKMPPKDIPKWRALANRLDTADRKVTVAIVGKYTGLTDSYLSIIHALRHAAMEINVRLELEWVDAEHLEQQHPTTHAAAAGTSSGGSAGTAAAPATAAASSSAAAPAAAANPHATLHEGQAPTRKELATAAWAKISACDGLLVPGGFGDRGVEGMIIAVRWARVHRKPFLGICLGMQVAVIEWCRSVLGLADAQSAEFATKGPHPVIVEMPEIDQVNLGGTMRLGSRRTNLAPHTLAAQLYGHRPFVLERHRHRFEVNPKYVAAITASGLVFSGVAEKQHAADDSLRMEIIELPPPPHPAPSPAPADDTAAAAATAASTSAAAAKPAAATGAPAATATKPAAAAAADVSHPFFFGVQFHPEFLSRPLEPSPPFRGFVQAASGVFVHGTGALGRTSPVVQPPPPVPKSPAKPPQQSPQQPQPQPLLDVKEGTAAATTTGGSGAAGGPVALTAAPAAAAAGPLLSAPLAKQTSADRSAFKPAAAAGSSGGGNGSSSATK